MEMINKINSKSKSESETKYSLKCENVAWEFVEHI